MGLFLGYALLHVPDLFIFLYHWIAARIPAVAHLLRSRICRKTRAVQDRVETRIESNDRRRNRGDRKESAEERIQTGKESKWYFV